jgi:hypothetical protein
MAVSRPQPWSLIGLATSIPSAWGGHGGGHVVGHKIQLGPPPSAAGCTGDLGRRQREDLPATARIDRPRPQHLARVPGWRRRRRCTGFVGAVDGGGLPSVTGPAVRSSRGGGWPHTMTGEHWRGNDACSSGRGKWQRAFPFHIHGRTRPGRTAVSTAVPGVLLTRKGHRFKPCRAHQAQRI